VVPSIPFIMLIFDEEVSLLSLAIEAQCWEHQPVESPWIENVVVFMVVLFRAQIVMVQPFVMTCSVMMYDVVKV